MAAATPQSPSPPTPRVARPANGHNPLWSRPTEAKHRARYAVAVPSNDRDPSTGEGDIGAAGDGQAGATGKRVAANRSATASSLSNRTATGARGRTPTGRQSFSTKWAIDRLDEREKRYSLVAAVGAAAFAVSIYLDETNNKQFRLAKGQLTPQSTLVVGLICAALLLGAALLGRRAPVGFVALFTGASFSSSFFFLGLPFFALAVWLLYRSYKVQRDANANAVAAGSGMRAAAAARSSGATPARGNRAAPARTGGSRKRSATGPQANKRYTPKRPPPPKPKPPRRERKESANPGQS